MALTCLPQRVAPCLRGLGPCGRPRHLLGFSGVLGLHLVDGEQATLKTLARHGPAPLASPHDRWLLGAAAWGTKTWRWWFADQALQAFPRPEDGILTWVGDRTRMGTRGATHPAAQQTRLTQRHPDVFGVRIVIRMAPWETSRLPVDCARVRRPERTGLVSAPAARVPAAG